MARTGGDRTRKRILAVAEKLFSSGGFDATSVDQIAREAGVNKALIYYHFENKDDLVLKLFDSIIEEVSRHVEKEAALRGREGNASLRRKIQEEVAFLAGRKRILTVMLAEALRANQRDDFLFRCAELVIQREHGGNGGGKGKAGERSSAQVVHEFFTGFIPLVAFVVLEDKFCEYFGRSPDEVAEAFIDAFARSHLASHVKR